MTAGGNNFNDFLEVGKRRNCLWLREVIFKDTQFDI